MNRSDVVILDAPILYESKYLVHLVLGVIVVSVNPVRLLRVCILPAEAIPV